MKTVLLVLAEATDYQAARWLLMVLISALCKGSRLFCMDVYAGLLDIISRNIGNDLMAEAFR